MNIIYDVLYCTYFPFADEYIDLYVYMYVLYVIKKNKNSNYKKMFIFDWALIQSVC